MLLLNLSHHRNAILEADLVSSSHLSGGSLAHTVKYLVEYINLLLAQRIFKRYAELVELVREISGVDIALSVVVKCIDYHYTSSFQVYDQDRGYLPEIGLPDHSGLIIATSSEPLVFSCS